MVDCHGGSLRETDQAPIPLAHAGSVLVATSVRIALTATDRVATLNESLSQISTSVCAALLTTGSFLATQDASRCSGVPGSVTVSTSLASAACALYRSSRSAPLAIVFHRSSRGRAVIRSRSLV